MNTNTGEIKNIEEIRKRFFEQESQGLDEYERRMLAERITKMPDVAVAKRMGFDKVLDDPDAEQLIDMNRAQRRRKVAEQRRNRGPVQVPNRFKQRKR